MDNFDLKKYLVENKLTKDNQLEEVNLDQSQETLLKDLYIVIKKHYSTLSNQQIIDTIDQLKDLYK